MSKVELYKYTGTNVRYWSADPDYEWGTIEIVHGVLHGALQSKVEEVEENQSGRDLIEQIDLQLAARVKAKQDIGYRLTIEESKNAQGENTAGFFRPMLAKRLDRIKSVKYDDMYLQMKYDGHRCLVTRTTSGIVAYSRNGRPIKSIGHILDKIVMPIGTTLDGELYCHRTPLQSISSWVKRKQHNTTKLIYIVYDLVDLKMSYSDRYNAIRHLNLPEPIMLAPTDKTVEEHTVPMMLENAVSLGYEGLMLRDRRSKYEPGKRSGGLIKVKQFMDSEFKVMDVQQSVDGWGILVCAAKNGQTFNVSAPGSMHHKQLAWKHRAELIGRLVTVKYANLTDSGIPFHPIAERWKDEL